MRKFSRPVVMLLAAVFGLAVIALISINLYVQSQGIQARIQQELSHRLGATLHIRRISVTPWGGLKLSGITIPQTSNAHSGDFLKADSFHLRVRLLSLFSRRLVIKEISLVDPNVVWPQNSEGKWELPGSREEERTIGEKEGTTLAAVPTPEAAPLPSLAGSTPLPFATPDTVVSRAAPETWDGFFIPEIRRLNVTGGNFHFLDRTGGVIATFETVNVRSNLRSAVSLRGKARVAKISLRNRFFLEDLTSPLRYDPDVLDLPKISARVANGDVTGRFTIQPQSADSPFTVTVSFRNVRADQVVAEAGGPSGVIEGKLEGNLEAAGRTADVNALTGTGEIFLREGKVQQYSLLVALGQVLQIEELTQLQLQEARAKYHITPGLVTIDELILQSPNIRLSAKGTITFKGKLRLESQLAINDKIRGQLFKPIRENFLPTGEGGYSAIDFQVSGTVDRPKSNLVERAVGRNLKDFVSGLFGGEKKERSKKKKSVEAAVTLPAEEATPSPLPALPESPSATATAAEPSPAP